MQYKEIMKIINQVITNHETSGIKMYRKKLKVDGSKDYYNFCMFG